MLNIVKTSNAYNRPKHKREVDHDQWGVHDTEAPKGKKTLIRNVTHAEAMKFIKERESEKPIA